MSVFVIGEMASAHDGDLGKAKQLVDAAVAAGCDAVKVQFWSDANQLADRRKVPDYYRKIYQQYQIPVEWLSILKEYCGDRIEFMATCFLPEDAATISPFVQRFKISAFESGAQDLVRAVQSIRGCRQIIASAPMSLNFNFYFSPDVLMYCVSAYPTPLSHVQLGHIWRGYGRCMGFSDHTGDLDMGAYAVCAGATYIEAHMMLPTTDALNPDAGSFAHLPSFMTNYVSNIRKAERVCYGKPIQNALTQYYVVTP